MRLRILALVAAAAIAVLGSAGVLAQEATPAATGERLFADLGLAEITVTATDEGFTVEPAEVEAGRYLVTLNNEGANPQMFAGLVQLPEGMTVEDLSYADEVAAGTPMPPMEMGPSPEQLEAINWLYEAYIPGGMSTITPVANQAVLDLRAGDYGVWGEDPFSAMSAAALTVTGDAEAEIAGPEPEAAVTIIEEGEGGVGYSFRLEGELQAGLQIVKILNASDQPHFVEASQYPEPVTMDQVMAAFMFDPSTGATPTPDMIDFERITYAGWAGTQSTGTTQWVVMDFTPGQALLVCFIPDPLTGGTPHAFEGMAELFDVTEA
jgi:hypothetical protein